MLSWAAGVLLVAVVLPQKHVFVCVNEREIDHPLPCCGFAAGMTVYQRLLDLVLRHGLTRRIQVTRSLCLSTCRHGVSAIVYPEQCWYGHLTPAKAERVFHEHLLGDVPVAAYRIDGDGTARRHGEEG